jgi:hypothetical protein
LIELLAHRAENLPPSLSLAEEDRLCSLLLGAAARDSRARTSCVGGVADS